MLLKARFEFSNKTSTEFRPEFVGQMQANLLEKNTAKLMWEKSWNLQGN